MKRTVEWSQYQNEEPYESALVQACFEVEKRARLAFDPFLARQVPFRYLTKKQWQDIEEYRLGLWNHNGHVSFGPGIAFVIIAEWSRPKNEFTKERNLPYFTELFDEWSAER